jgi:DNA-binding HxlR family transcriptional regulator
MLVLRDIMFGNRRHFRELMAASEEGIAGNILASRRKQLVTPGLSTRDDARRGQRATYSLTEAGIQVLPVMIALGNWGLAHRHGERRLRGGAVRYLLDDVNPVDGNGVHTDIWPWFTHTHLGAQGVNLRGAVRSR